MIYLLVLIAALYLLLIILYWIGWERAPQHNLPDFFQPNITITILIPARNEEKMIARCLQAIKDQTYPKELVEIILIDDHSEDNTAFIAAEMNVRVIDMRKEIPLSPSAYKKNALHAGALKAKGELIITTDADCRMNNNWLRSIAYCYEQGKADMIISPVLFEKEKGWFNAFQRIDFLMMQGITVASNQLQLGSMSNGANLCFRAEVFHELKGYQQTTHVASGDDYMLMHKFKQAGKKIKSLKSMDAVVYTPAQPNWRSFLNQRIRWSSKSGKYPDLMLTLCLIIVYLYNLTLLVGLILSFLNPQLFMSCILLLMGKVIAESLLLKSITKFFRQYNLMKWLWVLQPLHILYIIVAGGLGWVGPYEWKGRRVS